MNQGNLLDDFITVCCLVHDCFVASFVIGEHKVFIIAFGLFEVTSLLFYGNYLAFSFHYCIMLCRDSHSQTNFHTFFS